MNRLRAWADSHPDLYVATGVVALFVVVSLVVIAVARVCDADRPTVVTGAERSTSNIDVHGVGWSGDYGPSVAVVHDDRRGVTCWIATGSQGIACLPDTTLADGGTR